MDARIPSQIKIRRKSGCLELSYEDGQPQELSFEFLRVHSPSAEVQGHGIGNEVLQYGKRGVFIEGIEPVGNYGLKIIFSDGHDSGIFTWPLLERFCTEQEALWHAYLDKLDQAGKSRNPGEVDTVPINFLPGGCGKK